VAADVAGELEVEEAGEDLLDGEGGGGGELLGGGRGLGEGSEEATGVAGRGCLGGIRGA
jgi:hypothetical protein